jgi:4-diphosphocytidyl-2-C-methyl-D-erythritol kinase
LKDAAEITRVAFAKKDHSPGIEFTATGAPIPGDAASNLCIKAWQLIKNDFPDIPPLKMHLHKAIPVGGGLGGGSSNGAHTLLLLNEELDLHLSKKALAEYALKLGSDCPFFIFNKPSHATGRGEKIEEIKLSLADHYFVVVHPHIHVDTGWAFAQLKKTGSSSHAADAKTNNLSLTDIVQQPVSTWKKDLVNDFERPVFNEYPLLKEIKEMLYAAGAEYASMTGTGSCVYGIFSKKKKAATIPYDEKYKVYTINRCL